MIDGVPLFKGEAMLLGWADTSTRGKTVTFALGIDEAPEAHPFRGLGTGKHGQRFMIVAVPITDDGKPDSPGASSEPVVINRKDSALPLAAEDPGSAPAPSPGSAPGDTAKERRRFHTLPLAQQAAMMCEREDFIKWCGAQFDATDAAQWVPETERTRMTPKADTDEQVAERVLELDTEMLALCKQSSYVAASRKVVEAGVCAPDLARRLIASNAALKEAREKLREVDVGPLTFADIVTLEVFLEALAEEDTGGHEGDDMGCDLCAGISVLKKITKAARARRDGGEG